MPHNKNDRSAANAFIERLFRDGYHDYVRYTEINLQKHGSKYLSVSGCAEDVVQEAFYLICERAGGGHEQRVAGRLGLPRAEL